MPRHKKSSTSVTRGASEQHRRNQMKALFSNLASVLRLQVQPSMERVTVLEFLEHAIAYVKALKNKVKKLKKKKQDLEADQIQNVPVVTVNEMNKSGDFEVNLIVGINKNFVLSEVLSILEEQGCDILSVHYITVGYKIVHKIICQATLARIGIDGPRVLEKLNMLVF